MKPKKSTGRDIYPFCPHPICPPTPGPTFTGHHTGWKQSSEQAVVHAVLTADKVNIFSISKVNIIRNQSSTAVQEKKVVKISDCRIHLVQHTYFSIELVDSIRILDSFSVK